MSMSDAQKFLRQMASDPELARQDAAAHRQELVKLAREQDPDLVTLDIELAKDSPGDSWDGFSIAGWLRRLHEGKPKPIFIVISGNRRPDKIVKRAFDLGIYTCLTKPVDKKQLLETVAEALK